LRSFHGLAEHTSGQIRQESLSRPAQLEAINEAAPKSLEQPFKIPAEVRACAPQVAQRGATRDQTGALVKLGESIGCYDEIGFNDHCS
jgi:hypothetical protein